MKHSAVRRLSGIDFELLQKRAEAHPGSLLADAYADRSILVMDAQSDDGAFETRIRHSGHRQQQLARQETRLVHTSSIEQHGRNGQALSRHPSRL